MKQLTLFILILGLSACVSRQTNLTEEKSVEHTGNSKIGTELFHEFLETLKLHSTPIQLNCSLPDYTWASEYKTYKAFLPTQYDAVYGLVGQPENFKCIMFGQIGDDIYPTLFTYHNNGHKIDSLYLVLNPCGAADDQQIPNSFALIKNDFTIELTDTTRLIHFSQDSKSANNYVVDSLRITKVIFKIDKDGRFVRL